jgi:hypothetical protein
VSRCELDAARGIHSHCTETECVFWRVTVHLDLVEPASGCAIQYFELLGEDGAEVAEWLQSVRKRLEQELADDEEAGSA